MTKAEFIEQVLESVEGDMTKKSCNEVVDAVFAVMTHTVKKEGRFAFPGFGSFMLRRRKARVGRNPQTGEAIKIKASKSVGFKPAQAFRGAL